MPMPYSEQHKTQKRKNIAVAATLVGLLVVLFVITMVRLSK